MNKENKEFVPYEQTFELKKLGFEYTQFSYRDGYYTIILENALYQQVFRWFRDKHNLCGEVYTVNMGAIDYSFMIRDLHSENYIHDNFQANTGGYTGTFESYEEAELECLKKLIEIVKSKTNG